ncbi:hypothetical protein LIER_36850 [Lithospermum erythrorhizon]|uniref:Uncharacterized protein n=1 Tax=Lithospermum erythrorhizon TaxID=34254 RepID=A0AAV3PD31_LITER
MVAFVVYLDNLFPLFNAYFLCCLSGGHGYLLNRGGAPNLYLRIHDHEEDEDTILAAHPPLHRGCCPPWGALSSRDSGGDTSWTPKEISHQFALVGRGCWTTSPYTLF